MKIDTRQVAYRPAEQGAADRRNSPLSKKFLKAVCGISVVKRKITPVFTGVIFYLSCVDKKDADVQPLCYNNFLDFQPLRRENLESSVLCISLEYNKGAS